MTAPPSETSGPDLAPTGVDCSIAATLSVVGDRWTVLVLRDVFRGVHRFGELQRDLGIAKNLLADRLSKLVDHGVLERIPYQERPVRYEYRLTAKGADLSTALIALMGWGDRWYARGAAPTVLVHQACGTPIEQSVRCPECDVSVNPGRIKSRPGPGRRPR
ncbi:MAG: helix-turn-helix domain-containing protein [Actinomycetota bacterium]